MEGRRTAEWRTGEGKGILGLANHETVKQIGMIEKDRKVGREGDSNFGPGI